MTHTVQEPESISVKTKKLFVYLTEDSQFSSEP